MNYDEGSVRRLFAEEPLPPGLEHWSPPGPAPGPAPRTAPSRRTWMPALATVATVLVLSVGVALLHPFNAAPPDVRTGAAASATSGLSPSPSAPAGTTPSAGHSPGASASARSPATSAPARTWPGAATTGVPAGTTLRTHNGDLRITRAGEVVSDLLAAALERLAQQE